jgi:OOP family OmpA-OmpF porin
MKTHAMYIVLATVLLGATTAQASEFDGGWLGGKIGANRSGVTGVDRKSATAYGLEGGHNWNKGSYLLGVDGFVDANDSADHNPAPFSYGSSVYGVDAKLGLPSGNWLPYAKLGYAHTDGDGAAGAIGGSDVHFGLGVEYKFAPSWSVAGEYTTASGKTGAQKLSNDNFTIGLNYYFGVPAPVAPVVPVATKKEESKAAPAPVPETWKTLLENKPVCIEGANFEFDSAKLRSGEIKKLDEVVTFAGEYPDAQLEASGHTCNIGTEEYNQKLSERRAESVKAYMVKNGVAAQRIVTVGYGESKPMADNNTRAGRELNRRVEVCTELKVEKKVRVTE